MNVHGSGRMLPRETLYVHTVNALSLLLLKANITTRGGI
jgi:hypothetical protein